MIRNLRQGNFGIDILAIVAIGACLYAQEYSAAYVIILMLSSGEALEKLANRRANRELSALIKRRPQTAHIVIDGTISNVPLAKIKIGDILLVKANEVVPVDGTTGIQPRSMNESSITGESMPVDKKPGTRLFPVHSARQTPSTFVLPPTRVVLTTANWFTWSRKLSNTPPISSTWPTVMLSPLRSYR